LPALLFSLSGCGVLSWFSPSRPSPKAVAPLAKQAVKVEVDTNWQARLYGTWRLQPYETSNIAVGEGHIYLVDASGHLLCLDLGGKQDWMVRLDGKSARGPTLADGILYVGTDSGKLYAFSAKNGQRLWVTQLDSEVLSPITVSKDAVLAQLDFVTASIHAGLGADRAIQTRRLVRAMENPHVDAIGHPTGRILGRREPYELDLEEVVAAAARTGTALELNAQLSRLDLSTEHLRLARERGVQVVVNSDAHGVEGLRNMVFGVRSARRGWLGRAQVRNARPWTAD
jgi:hypothetical protein